MPFSEPWTGPCAGQSDRLSTCVLHVSLCGLTFCKRCQVPFRSRRGTLGAGHVIAFCCATHLRVVLVCLHTVKVSPLRVFITTTSQRSFSCEPAHLLHRIFSEKKSVWIYSRLSSRSKRLLAFSQLHGSGGHRLPRKVSSYLAPTCTAPLLPLLPVSLLSYFLLLYSCVNALSVLTHQSWKELHLVEWSCVRV